MTDAVPELLEDIITRFNTFTISDRRLRGISRRIRDGTATQIDGHAYAERLGVGASRALKECLTEDRLPDGKLYYNIATRTVIPVLENNQALVNQAATEIQKVIDKADRVGLSPVEPVFPRERINGLIDKMTADNITLDSARIWIGEPIVNNSEAFFDDFVRENAKFRADAGMKSKITRIVSHGCCSWCDALAGTYDYGNEPQEIYARHEYCRCAVTFQSQKTSQNVWTKKKWESTPEEITRRENTKVSTMSKNERIQVLDRLDKDRLVRQIMDATGYDRATANRIADKSPGAIAKAIERGRKNAYRR